MSDLLTTQPIVEVTLTDPPVIEITAVGMQGAGVVFLPVGTPVPPGTPSPSLIVDYT